MTAGRPAKPTALKILHGNPGKRPLNQAEVQPVIAGLTPPKWLSGYARVVWGELAPIPHGLGLLTEADVELFAHACKQLAVARKRSGNEGLKALDAANRILARFGFTPSDRAKLSVQPAKVDPFGDYLAGKAK